MRYVLKKVILYVGLIGLFFNLAVAMDVSVNKDNDCLFRSRQVIQIILTHQVNLDHDIICSLAINKEYEKALINTAQQRKTYMESKIPQDFLQQPSIIWHKYGSACGNKKIENDCLKLFVFY